ncbi:MAG: hypothetical protein AAFR84_01040 [Pseudomonadota bacterium]
MRFVIFLAALAVPGIAAACDPAEAEGRWLNAEDQGIILGTEMRDGVPTFVVDGITWDSVDSTTRRGMFVTFECMIAGTDGVLAEAQAVDDRGRAVARWDGVRSKVEILR